MKTADSNRQKRLWKKFLRRKKRILLNKRKKNISNIVVGIKKVKHPKRYIQIPSNLSFGSNWEEVVKTFNDIKHSIKYGSVRKEIINIDHSMMSSATPSGILVLASTIERSQKICKS